MTVLEDLRAVEVADYDGAPRHRAAVLADLADSVEAYFAEHRRCDALDAAIVEASQAGAAWAVARMVCACGIRWERHLKLHA